MDAEQAPAPSPTSQAALNEAHAQAGGPAPNRMPWSKPKPREGSSSDGGKDPLCLLPKWCQENGGPWIGSTVAEWLRGLSFGTGLASMWDEGLG